MYRSELEFNIDRYTKGKAALVVRWWLLTLFIVLYLIWFLPASEYPQLAILTLFPTTLALVFGLMPLILNQGKRQLFDPVTLFNAGLFYYSLKGVSLAWGDRTQFLSHIDMAQVAARYPSVALLTVFGIIAWNWGYIVADNRFFKEAEPRNALPMRYLNPRFGVLALSVAGTLSFVFLIRSTGEGLFVFLMQSWRRGYLSDPALSGGVSAFASLLVPGMLLLPLASILWAAILGNNRQSPGYLFWIYNIYMVVALFLVMPRATLLGSLLSLMFVYHYTIRPLRLLYLAGFGFLGMVYAYVMGLWRVLSHSVSGVGQMGSVLQENISSQGLSDFVISGSLTDIRVFVLVVHHYGEDLSFRWGETLLRVITQFVPRALWPSKPLDVGVELGRLSNPYTISGTPAGFLAEMYMNFNFVGVLVGAFLLGVLLNFLYRRWLPARHVSALSVVLYALTIPRVLLLPSSTLSIAFVSWAIPVVAATFAFGLCLIDKTTRKQPAFARSLA